ncbi:MAG: RNA 2',3'-cyclic phosphodiesterase [Candidatus Eisenbacteria bacterium]|nr:RNA 2',3'-cyclic phosphodiesterase [Candidatus Eisenbacteria bacterium]
MDLRLFVALELPPEVKDGILTVVGDLRSRGVRASWARPGTIHLTLAFLGDTDEALVASIGGALREAASNVRPFEWSIRGLGAFPSPRRPRVIWAGVDAPDELFELKREIDAELRPLGYSPDRRRFRPHITLGRVRRASDAAGLERHMADVEIPALSVPSNELLLMRSTLRPGGALHEALEHLPLTGGGDAPGT